MRPYVLFAAALSAAATLSPSNNLQAQSFSTHPCNDKSDDHSFLSHFFGGNEQACEIRSTIFPLISGHLNVKTQNGGIQIIGEDRPDIALEARVSAHGGSESDAASMVHDITIETGGTVEAHGPHTSGSRNWSVSYKLRVPHHLAANLHALNGALSLNTLDGSIHADTTNGSLSFDHLAGDVHLSTTNGSVSAHLDGPTWRGVGLEATTTHGGVSVSLSASYSAHLVADTVNGGTSLNIPSANQSGVHRHSIDTNLGSGGPTIHFETVNGGISIQ